MKLTYLDDFECSNYLFKSTKDEDDMAAEVRSSQNLAKRRASSLTSSESVRVLAMTPTRADDGREFSVTVSRSRSRNMGSISESEPSQTQSMPKVKNRSFTTFTV